MPAGIYVRTKEIREKIRKAKKGCTVWNKGLKCQEATKRKIRESLKGHEHSKATKKKMSIASKGKNKSKGHKKNIAKAMTGKLAELACGWKGGRSINGLGYVKVMVHNHPFARNGYVLEHRLVMEKHLGRYLKNEEVVHHIDKNTGNNVIGNLMLFPNNTAHLRFHSMQKSKK